MLELKHVSVAHHLRDVSFSLAKGEVIVIIGPNGSGKSLLCRVIADPDIRLSGEITVNHFSSQREPGKVKLQIGYATTSNQIEPYLTGFEYLEMIGSFYHLAPAARQSRILALAQQFRCLDQLYTLGERLSAAEAQKIGLMASLLAEPTLLVWDEPTQFLDETSRQAVLNELKAALKAGASAVVATNDLALAQTIADRIIVLDRGQMVTEGTPSQLEQLARSTSSGPAGAHQKNLAAAFEHLLTHD